ncbi:uncharacterized protein LOC143038905 [Oratosquilla oratoria]|uniref:uncharacterized protein LOC143038905 n=1 Tax=Oratosquilla oratoria TaxID=337810 RepID=UPI003F769AA0
MTAGLLTFLAEELGRVLGTVWGGFGVAFRLNNAVVSQVLDLLHNLVQLLLLLTQKAADLASIVVCDFVTFMSDIGAAAVAVCDGMQTLLMGIWVALTTLYQAVLLGAKGSVMLVQIGIMNVIKSAVDLASQLALLLQMVKRIFIVFGSAVMFLIGFVPNLILLILSLMFSMGAYIRTCFVDAVSNMWSSVVFISHMCLQSVKEFFCDIPLEAIVGVVLGVCAVVGLHYILQYMTDHLILIPDMPVPSLIRAWQRRILTMLAREIRRANAPVVHQNDTEEEELGEDDGNDENGNDSNDNVPDLNLPENQGLVQHHGNAVLNNHNQRLPTPPHSPSRFVAPGRPLLARQPLTRRQQQLQGAHDSGSEVQAGSQITLNPEAHPTTTSTATTNSVNAHELSLEDKAGSSGSQRHSEVEIQLYRELEDERESRLCVVCQDHVKCVILLPCRHLCLCDACRSAIITRDNACPMCRRPIRETLRVYV